MLRLAARESLKGGRSKTGIKARVPINSPLFREVLEDLNKEFLAFQRFRPKDNPQNRVFTKNGTPINPRALRSAFDRRKAKEGLLDFRIKDLRHTAITRWSQAGIPWDYSMEMSGHASIAMYKRYMNPRDEQLKAVASRAAFPW